MKLLIRGIVLACSIVILTGCFSSTISLHKGGIKEVDYSLTGLWFTSKFWHTHIYLHIVRDHDRNMRLIRVASPVSNRGEDIQLDEFYIFPTKINNVRYMNLEFSNHDKDRKIYKKKYWFVKYKLINPKVLKIWVLRHQALARAIKSGQLKGKVWMNGKQKRISLYDNRDNLVKWLAQTKDRVDWQPPQTYTRLNKAVYREY